MKCVKSKTNGKVVRMRKFFVLNQLETRQFMKIATGEIMQVERNNAIYNIESVELENGLNIPVIVGYNLKINNKLEAKFAGVINGRVVESNGQGQLLMLNNKECKALANNEVVNYVKNGVSYKLEYTFNDGLISTPLNNNQEVEFDDVLLQNEITTTQF